MKITKKLKHPVTKKLRIRCSAKYTVTGKLSGKDLYKTLVVASQVLNVHCSLAAESVKMIKILEVCRHTVVWLQLSAQCAEK